MLPIFQWLRTNCTIAHIIVRLMEHIKINPTIIQLLGNLHQIILVLSFKKNETGNTKLVLELLSSFVTSMSNLHNLLFGRNILPNKCVNVAHLISFPIALISLAIANNVVLVSSSSQVIKVEYLIDQSALESEP